MTQASGRQVLWAAVIVGIAVIAGSLVLARSLERVTARLGETDETLDKIRVAVEDAGESFAAVRGPVGPQRPDPNRRYTVNLDGAPALGPATAAITIVEFSDFQCPFCGRVGPTLQQVRDTYGDQVRIVFKHLPLDMHQKAPEAHAAAESAGRQGKFWEMHDKIFANQREMSAEKYKQYAGELGLDVARFEKDLASSDVKDRIAADKREAARLGATGTPSFFINGRFLSGARPFEAFKELIDAELADKKEAKQAA